MVNATFWKNRKVLITGHTGFKGGWLSVWLKSMGADLLGYSLAPNTEPNLYTVAHIGDHMESIFADIADEACITQAVREFQPEIIFHMAAQPLVRESFVNPVETYRTNIMGTINLLEAARHEDSVRVIVNITTDKCYENQNWPWSYRENDALGGYDPYSSSKACAELVSAAYRSSFFTDREKAMATVRAGNVIGGGDWSADRIIPDCIRSFQAGTPVTLRYPQAVRPWQHVLCPLSGYLTLAEKLYHDRARYEGAWNFGPAEEDTRTVEEIVRFLCDRWPFAPGYQVDTGTHYHETALLRIDSAKARWQLGWKPSWALEDTLNQTLDWYRHFVDGADMEAFTLKQIQTYQHSLPGVS